MKKLKPTSNLTLQNFRTVATSSVHSSTLPSLVNPWFITGFTDAEGCFHIGINKNSELKTSWEVRVYFHITVHQRDRTLLELIKASLGVGNISNQGKDLIQYRVSSIKDLNVIISHFEKYPLISNKWADYQLFKKVVELIKCKEHLTPKGLQEILAIKASAN